MDSGDIEVPKTADAYGHLSGADIPEVGQIVHLRTRTYLVDDVVSSPAGALGTLVKLVCVDDDAQGQPLEVIWELELEKRIIDREAWKSIGKKDSTARSFLGPTSAPSVGTAS